MMSYFEWGICLVSVCFCWCKYGWRNAEVIKGFRQMLKKIEVILASPTITTNTGAQWMHGREAPGYLSLPVSRAHFSRRKKPRSLQSMAKEDLAFYKTFSLSLANSNLYSRCCICLRHKADETEAALGKSDKTTGLVNCLDCDTRNPENPWYIRRFAFFVFFWRKWFIGPQYHMVHLKEMMADERLISAIEETARQELQENANAGTLQSLIKKHRKRAERVVINMRAKQSAHPYFAIYVRIAAWIIGKTLALIYPKILVEKSQIDAIKKARATGNPIIFLPIHRSHVDYVLVSWTLVNSDIRAPLVAAGENLNIPVFSLMMKSVGGFFIKRRLDRNEGKKDILYRAILQTYMKKSLEDDNDLEFFIEGGRTRTGKPCHPKGGLLSIAVDTLVSRKVDDIFIVPVNFSYEKLVEGNYIREQLGQAKVKESFASAALGLWNSVQLTKFGNAKVDYGKPFSMKEYIQTYRKVNSPSPLQRIISTESEYESNDLPCLESSPQNKFSKQSSLNSDELIIHNQRELVNNLAQHVIYDGVKCFTLMSTSAIAFLLLNKYRHGVTMEKLVEEMEILKKEFLLRNHTVIFDGETQQVIEHGLAVLGPSLVRKDLVKTNLPTRPTEIVLRPVTIVPKVIDLSYYSTCVTPIYALESVIATSILYLTKSQMIREKDKNNAEEETMVMEAELISTCLELCGILHHEFIFHPPCQTLEDTLRKSLKFLETEGLLRIQNVSDHSDESDGESHLTSPPIEKRGYYLISISNSSIVVNRFKFLSGLIRPLLDTYFVSSKVLKRLVDCEAQEKQLQMEMLAEVRSHLQQKTIHFGESLALDPIRNFIKLIVRWQVVECFRQDGVSIYTLQEHFDNEKSVDEVIQRIQRFLL